MARHQFSNYQPIADPDLDVSSLIDVCFLLLIYFLAMMTIVPAERDLVMGLPTPGEHNPANAKGLAPATGGAPSTVG